MVKGENALPSEKNLPSAESGSGPKWSVRLPSCVRSYNVEDHEGAVNGAGVISIREGREEAACSLISLVAFCRFARSTIGHGSGGFVAGGGGGRGRGRGARARAGARTARAGHCKVRELARARWIPLGDLHVHERDRNPALRLCEELLSDHRGVRPVRLSKQKLRFVRQPLASVTPRPT